MASSSSPMRMHTILRGLRTVDDYTSGGPLPAASSGAIAQLGERLDRTQEVAGSSPASSIEVPGNARVLNRRLVLEGVPDALVKFQSSDRDQPLGARSGRSEQACEVALRH